MGLTVRAFFALNTPHRPYAREYFVGLELRGRFYASLVQPRGVRARLQKTPRKAFQPLFRCTVQRGAASVVSGVWLARRGEGNKRAREGNWLVGWSVARNIMSDLNNKTNTGGCT